MNLDNIIVNAQSSIKISGSRNLYFDAFQIQDETHDADIVFITHEHFDHFDAESIKKVMNSTTIIAAPLSMKAKLLKDGPADESRYIFLEPGMSVKIKDVDVTGVPAYNVLKPFHPKHNKWLGYVVRLDARTYYIAGDTDPIAENAKIRCDVAFVPVGGGYTMGKKHAAEFVADMKPKAAVPIHYGNVVGSPEDGQKFKEIVEGLNSEIQVELKLG